MTTTRSGQTAMLSDRPPLDRAAADVLAGKICASAAEQARATCQLLEFVGEFDAGAGWSWMSGMKSMAHWLSWSYSKVREISRVAGLVDEARLCSLARFSTASQLARMIAAFRTAAGLRLREQERRRFQLVGRDGGEYTGVSGRYPNDEAAVVGAAIQRARDLNGPPPKSAAQPDPTPPYTDADAFLDICRHDLDTAVTDDDSGEDRSLVVVEFAAGQLGATSSRAAGDVPAESSEGAVEDTNRRPGLHGPGLHGSGSRTGRAADGSSTRLCRLGARGDPGPAWRSPRPGQDPSPGIQTTATCADGP